MCSECRAGLHYWSKSLPINWHNDSLTGMLKQSTTGLEPSDFAYVFYFVKRPLLVRPTQIVVNKITVGVI